MRILQVQQGTDSWHAERARRFTASEAPAMMGASKYTTRSALLQQKATGITPEVSAQKQALFDRGHASEATARAIVEEMIGEDLFPATAVHDTDDRLLASFDGVTMMEDPIMEHKLWSEPLAAQVRAGELEPHYYWQLEHQLLVSGASRAIFVCSDGTREKFASMEYRPVPGRREALLAGWDQFAKDLTAYVPPAAAAVVVAAPVQALPAVSVVVTGEIAIRDNFAAFEVAVRDFIEHRLIREPKTDQDFADLDVQIKAMKGAEAALEAAESQMLAQIQTVDQAKRTKDMLAKLVRENRLMAEKLLSSEKERRRGEIVAGAIGALKAHIDGLNVRLGRPYMPVSAADFGGVIKGLKSLASMEEKVATALANAKIEANATADRIQANLTHLREKAADVPHLFPDTATLVLRTVEDCALIVQARITEHKAAEERRLEAERLRIRAEEEAKARATAAREQQEREAAERRQREEAEAAQRREEALRVAGAAGPVGDPEVMTAPAAVEAAAAPAVFHFPTVKPEPAAAPTLRLGEINSRLAPLSITEEGLRVLGFAASGRDKRAVLYREAEFQGICAAIAQHAVSVANQQRAA
jgi:putative phage-type endonuclease